MTYEYLISCSFLDKIKRLPFPDAIFGLSGEFPENGH